MPTSKKPRRPRPKPAMVLDITQLIAVLAEEIEAGLGFEEAVEVLEDIGSAPLRPGSLDTIMAGILQPESERVAEACGVILTALLAEWDDLSRGGVAAAGGRIGQAREAALALLANPSLDVMRLLRLMDIFGDAGVEPGPALDQAIQARIAGAAKLADAGPEAVAAALEQMAEVAGDDPFVIHALCQERLARMPPDALAKLYAAMAGAPKIAMRMAALGLAMELPPDRAAEVLTVIGRSGRLPAPWPARMGRLRRWAPPAWQDLLDVALPASGKPEAKPPAPLTIRRIVYAVPDGAGAESFFIQASKGRKTVMASVLLKEGHGIKEVMLDEEMTPMQAAQMLDHVTKALATAEVSLDFLTLRLSVALQDGLQHGAMPPFAFLPCSEMLGLTALQPEPRETDALIESLLATIPVEELVPEAQKEARERVVQSLDAMLPSWFEESEAVSAVLRGVRQRQKREEAILHQILPARRALWARRCAWLAAGLREEAEHIDAAWDFALAASDLLGDVPLADIPLACAIARASVQAAAARR